MWQCDIQTNIALHAAKKQKMLFYKPKIIAWKHFNELGKAAEEQANNLQSQLNCQLGQ